MASEPRGKESLLKSSAKSAEFHLNVCSFCQLLGSLYSEGGLGPDDSALWREHLRLEHGWIAEDSLTL
jgi:hypothetical protein